VLVEEGQNTLLGVMGRFWVIRAATEHKRDDVDKEGYVFFGVVVHEGVVGVGIFFHVMIDAGVGQRLFEPDRRAFQRAVECAIAGDNRAGLLQELVKVFGQRAIVNAGDRKIATRGEQQSKAAAKTETDDADLVC